MFLNLKNNKIRGAAVTHILMNVANTLKKRRKELGITQACLAEKVDLTARMIQYYENEQSHYTLPVLQRVCEVLKMNIKIEPKPVKNNHHDEKRI